MAESGPTQPPTEELRETDKNGVEFGRNCLTPGICRGQNLCLGTCKLF